MKTIWKYNLEVVDDQLLEIPIEAEILDVQMQYGSPQLWAVVTPELQKETRHIRIHGTGHRVSTVDNLKYISTFQMEGGSLVFHAFEVVSE
ncbi:MAG TPA: hypothetical protein VI727_04105 [Candidatus Brocadiaceae bacterium]|nr:hypothetical protein [Candidatus Brocadiaceae bacterium]